MDAQCNDIFRCLRLAFVVKSHYHLYSSQWIGRRSREACLILLQLLLLAVARVLACERVMSGQSKTAFSSATDSATAASLPGTKLAVDTSSTCRADDALAQYVFFACLTTLLRMI